MKWMTQKSRPEELFGFRVAEISDGVATSWARLGRIRSMDRVISDYLSGYQLGEDENGDTITTDDARAAIRIGVHVRFSRHSEADFWLQ